VNTDGSAYAVIRSFAGQHDGANPAGGLVLVGNTLYGTTEDGGNSWLDYGTVFKVNTDGSGYAVLKSFTGGDGRYPSAALVLAGSTLYGTTDCGGHEFSAYNFGYGVVFGVACQSITLPPLTQTAERGTTVRFRVKAQGLTPGLVYQWFFGEANALTGATNDVLELINVQPFQAGAYTVHVADAGGGVVASAPASLSVIPPVERRVGPALRLTGSADNVLHVECADSLALPHWSSLSNLPPSTGAQFCVDLSQPLPAQRFYRAWESSGPEPVLAVSMAVRLTLPGAIGSRVRVDYINAIGPTNAWVTLDTVLLTNRAQLYYDFTASRQPMRLYRLVTVP
jgi:uncharacterized repeat protein (TIGR03803 family)